MASLNGTKVWTWPVNGLKFVLYFVFQMWHGVMLRQIELAYNHKPILSLIAVNLRLILLDLPSVI